MVNARKRILCIEDDRETAALIVEELADRGFKPIVAYSGREGFVAILKHRPDLVLCDINMPTMSGVEMLERLIELAPRFGHVPFVFLMAMTDRRNHLRGRRLGVDDYVTKPVDFDVLYAIINARFASIARNEKWPKPTVLNDREIETVSWVACGKTSAQVAKIIGLSKRTVDFHLNNGREKLGAATRTRAAIKAAVAPRFSKSDYSFIVQRIAHYPPQWGWEIYRHGEPLPVRSRGDNFRFKSGAEVAGKLALRQFLKALAREPNA
jgi:DNA-binding NarL/FixJ family response regulator